MRMNDQGHRVLMSAAFAVETDARGISQKVGSGDVKGARTRIDVLQRSLDDLRASLLAVEEDPDSCFDTGYLREAQRRGRAG